jgi:hypothetical protein
MEVSGLTDTSNFSSLFLSITADYSSTLPQPESVGERERERERESFKRYSESSDATYTIGDNRNHVNDQPVAIMYCFVTSRITPK